MKIEMLRDQIFFERSDGFPNSRQEYKRKDKNIYGNMLPKIKIPLRTHTKPKILFGKNSVANIFFLTFDTLIMAS